MSCMIVVGVSFKKLPTCFSRVAAPSYILTSNVSPVSLSAFGIVLVFILAVLTDIIPIYGISHSSYGYLQSKVLNFEEI